MEELLDILKENQIWPKEMEERYSQRVAKGGPECKSYSSCRNFDEMKDVAYCFATSQMEKLGENIPDPFEGQTSPYIAEFGGSANTLYYAETLRKSGSPNDYSQYLFARLPKDYQKYYKQYRAKGSNLMIEYKPFLFSFDRF